MRRPNNQQGTGPHALQNPAKNLLLLSTRGAYERSYIDYIEIPQVVLRAAGAVTAKGHGGRGDSEALTESGGVDDGICGPVYVEDEWGCGGLG
jgi:hypothetical protein